MNLRPIIYKLSLLLSFVCSFVPAFASHIVGGEMTYKCLGNNTYRLQIDIYIDCLTGDSNAILGDSTAYIGIFSGDGALLGNDEIRANPTQKVPYNIPTDCVDNFPTTCLNKITFVKNIRLNPSTTGYRILYQRCCRNATVQNLRNPGRTGASYYCDIPPMNLATCNNSAVFKNYPPQIICVNNPLVYDHSATDADADSLSYEFCQAYAGGSDGDAKPEPKDPTLIPVSYIAGYSATRPMAGNPRIAIDPKTGLITGTPTLQGRFVVTVCCNEWRNGVIINTVKREFQFVVTDCARRVVANIPQFSSEFNTYIVECNDYNVDFVNKSSGGLDYFWTFGDGDSSTSFEPSHTYADTGIYIVKLVVNRSQPACMDSIERIVKVFPSFKADFATNGLFCPNSPIQFNDLSTATYNPIIAWNWDFGDGTASTEQNPKHTYPSGSDYTVSMESVSIKGCRDTAVKKLTVDKFEPFAGNDTIIVKGERIRFNATGGTQYTWSPADGLSFPNSANAEGYYPEIGSYAYNVHIMSPAGCEGDDSIKVLVVAQASLFVPSAFSPNGDGLNDFLKPLGVGYANVRYFRVFNRFGEMVFNGEDFRRGWDGTYKGQRADLGTYFWVLGVTDRFGKEQQIKGDATLVQ
ncbi:MAG: PKD domain-containing protein [Sphingobacteriales bacterium]|nr:MAG: PKD domain-containing protein [Sphingobacteriales bacterium]